MNFDDAFFRLLGNEGRYSFNPADPGGETNFGISKRSYPDVDIKALTVDGAKVIYLRDFWNPIGDADAGIKFQVFDFAVNSGMQTAIRKLQAAIGVADDGHWGPISAAKLATLNTGDVMMRFIGQRLRFWASLSTWLTFGRGWAIRAATDLDFAAEDN